MIWYDMIWYDIYYQKITVYINTKSKDETHWGDDEINILDMIDNSTILKTATKLNEIKSQELNQYILYNIILHMHLILTILVILLNE